MRLIFSHMKGSLIESESCFACPGVSALTPGSQLSRMDTPAAPQTQARAHTVAVNHARATSGGELRWIDEMHTKRDDMYSSPRV